MYYISIFLNERIHKIKLERGQMLKGVTVPDCHLFILVLNLFKNLYDIDKGNVTDVDILLHNYQDQ